MAAIERRTSRVWEGWSFSALRRSLSKREAKIRASASNSGEGALSAGDQAASVHRQSEDLTLAETYAGSISETGSMQLPNRSGDRPQTTLTNPHQQLNQTSPAAIQEELWGRMASLEGVRTGSSGVSLPRIARRAPRSTARGRVGFANSFVSLLSGAASRRIGESHQSTSEEPAAVPPDGIELRPTPEPGGQLLPRQCEQPDSKAETPTSAPSVRINVDYDE